jgi:hypothetical protein
LDSSVSGNSIYILKAYPPDEAEVLSEITLNDTYVAGIFVSSNRLAVLASKYIVNYPVLPWDYYYATGYYVDVKTFVRIYDITDKEDPLS